MFLNDPATVIHSRVTAATMEPLLRALRRGIPSRLDERPKAPGDDFKTGPELMVSAHMEFVAKNGETSIASPEPANEVAVPEYKALEQEDGDSRT